MTVLERFNARSVAEASAELLPCCGSPVWADAMVALRPFDTGFDLTCTADRVWNVLTFDDWREAFDSHASSERKQKGPRLVEGEDPVFADACAKYRATFGFTFVVNDAGMSANEVFGVLKLRLANPPEAELREAKEQQRQVTQVRLRQWLRG